MQRVKRSEAKDFFDASDHDKGNRARIMRSIADFCSPTSRKSKRYLRVIMSQSAGLAIRFVERRQSTLSIKNGNA